MSGPAGSPSGPSGSLPRFRGRTAAERVQRVAAGGGIQCGGSRWGRVPVEAVIWTAGLLLMALADPDAAPWVRLCPFAHLGDWLGLHFCPGCGLGRSIGALARGDLAHSFALHPLAIPAVGMLLARSAALVRDAWRGPAVLPSSFLPPR